MLAVHSIVKAAGTTFWGASTGPKGRRMNSEPFHRAVLRETRGAANPVSFAPGQDLTDWCEGLRSVSGGVDGPRLRRTLRLMSAANWALSDEGRDLMSSRRVA